MNKYETLTQEQKAFILDELVKEPGNVDPKIILLINRLTRPAKADVFAFENFKQERRVFGKFYSGLELYLRLAIFLEYKYNYLDPTAREILNLVVKKSGEVFLARRVQGKLRGTLVTKKYFDNITNVFEPYQFLKRWYQHFAPEKSKESIQGIAEKYSGYECVAFNRMYQKYVDPEWECKPLWFTSEFRFTSQGEKQTMDEYYELHP
jgi:hypothetical protein